MRIGTLLLLKTPPPWGGGEVCALRMKERFEGREGVRVLELRSRSRSRANQGRASASKVAEQALDFSRYLACMARFRPRRVYLNLGQGTGPFLRDSAYVAVARALGARVCAELAGERFGVLDSPSRIVRAHASRTLRGIESVRVLGEGIGKRLEERGISGCEVIDNGVRVGGEAEVAADGDGDGVRVLFVGLHAPSKGLDALVRACALLRERGLPFALDTAGEWASEGFRLEMERLVAERGIGDRVRFHGRVVGEPKWDLFRRADVLALPSESEGQPLVLLEAMGFGLPVIATAVGGIPDVVEHGVDGLLLGSRDPEELADAIARLGASEEERRRMGEAARRKYLERFTEDAFLDRMERWLVDGSGPG